MSAAVPGVPAKAIEAAARAAHEVAYSTPWERMLDEHHADMRLEAAAALAAALPSLREQIAAEVLGPVRALADQYAATPYVEFRGWRVDSDIRAALSAPVQAAEPRCPTCGGSGSVTVDRGMGPEPVERCPDCAYTPFVQAAEEVDGE